MIIPSSRPSTQTFGDPLAWIYNPALVTATLAVSPAVINTDSTVTVTWTGSGTTWLSVAPTFTPSGVSGVSSGAVTVDSDTQAHATVTTGSNTGTVTWTDSTTSKTATQIVQFAGMQLVYIVPLPLAYYKPDFV